ncbi:hypothetical protein CC79DRAFT_1276671, partial [Sarocladium strictum]
VHFPPTRVVALENTLSGTILPLSEAKAISASKPIAMHLDAARIFDGIIGEGVDLKEYSACFNSMSICLAKGVGAPMSSVIIRSKQFIERGKWFRKMLGGGTRQPGMMVAAAHAALEETLLRFSKVRVMTKAAAARLETIGYKLAIPVQTNMIVLDLEAVSVTPAALVEYCGRAKVTVFPKGRLVFHYQTSPAAVDSLIKALTDLLEDQKSGVALSTPNLSRGHA